LEDEELAGGVEDEGAGDEVGDGAGVEGVVFGSEDREWIEEGREGGRDGEGARR